MIIDGKEYKLVPVWDVENPVKGQDDFLTTEPQIDNGWNDVEPAGYLLKSVEDSKNAK